MHKKTVQNLQTAALILMILVGTVAVIASLLRSV